ncbi:hypothetical protein ACGFT2_03555 [Streptomyces sp. NPDC048514]|uniref:hypothetical protein n=1 Tax=Streptomyces sp. NPDC048514 TaxID=3365564 RepID=UPI00371B1ED3
MTPYLDLTLADLRRVLDVDLAGPFLCGQRAARRMIRQARAVGEAAVRDLLNGSRRHVAGPRRVLR